MMSFCNLATRKDNMRNLEETFRYDDQNRLTEIRLGAVYSGTSTVVEKRGGEETLHYTPYSGGSTGYTNDCTLNSSNANVMSYSQGGASGGNIGGRINHSTPDNNVKHNNDIEVPSKLLTMANLYTTIESISYYNTYLRTWRDKSGIVRSMNFHGNQYTGGMNSYGKAMSKMYGYVGKVLGFAGATISFYQFEQATTIDGKLEYGFDTFIGFAGVFLPQFFGLPSTIWFLGGKQVIFGYARTTIIPMLEQGLNPGLMEYQPFK